MVHFLPVRVRHDSKIVVVFKKVARRCTGAAEQVRIILKNMVILLRALCTYEEHILIT